MALLCFGGAANAETIGIVDFDKIVDNILNQTQTDLCPMEKKVKGVTSPDDAYELLKTP